MRDLSRDNNLYIARLLKKCLYLGADASRIQPFVEELQRLDARDLHHFLSTDNRLAPLLFWHLRGRGLTSILTEKLAVDLGTRFLENVARNFLFERNLTKILAHFNRNAVEVVVLKGASTFTTRLSRFRDAFVLSDIDLMLRPADFTRAGEMLMSDGYSLKNTNFLNGALKQSFSGEDDCTNVDLHSDLFWTGVRINYTDYFSSDLWTTSIADSIGGYPVRMLSAEHELCYRLAHDALGHQALLLSNISRLYYLSLFIDFHRETLDWAELLQKLKAKRTAGLLAAYAHYGKRELGLLLPGELEKVQEAAGYVSYLDAVVGSSVRMADYNYRAAVAALMSRNLREHLNEICHHVAILSQRRGNDGLLGHVIEVFVRMCLQVLAVLYISVQTARHSIRESNSYVS